MTFTTILLIVGVAVLFICFLAVSINTSAHSTELIELRNIVDVMREEVNDLQQYKATQQLRIEHLEEWKADSEEKQKNSREAAKRLFNDIINKAKKDTLGIDIRLEDYYKDECQILSDYKNINYSTSIEHDDQDHMTAVTFRVEYKQDKE